MRFARFNKYRNAVATVAARESWHSELAIDTSVSLGADGLAVDSKHLYVKSANGNSLQALNVDNPGKAGHQTECLFNASGKIVDWNTALYDDSGLVVFGDNQGAVSVWKDRSERLRLQAHTSSCVVAQFHPTVAGIVVTAASDEVKLWNVNSSSAEAFWSVPSSSAIDSVSLKGDGQLLSAGTHDGTFAIFDPRLKAASIGSAAGKACAFHAPGRPVRVLWLGEKPFLLSTGMTRIRERSAALWDQRNLSQPVASLALQPSTKPLIPLFDEDTNLAYLVEKGDCAIRWVDADPSSGAPLSELGSVILSSQISGCALLPKRQLKIMGGEIARIYVASDNCGAGAGGVVIPISHVAPRRTYLDFHRDLFPDTRAPLPAQTYDQWMAQEPVNVPRMTLDPAKSKESLDGLRKAYGIQNESSDSSTLSSHLRQANSTNSQKAELEKSTVDLQHEEQPDLTSAIATAAAEKVANPDQDKKPKTAEKIGDMCLHNQLKPPQQKRNPLSLPEASTRRAWLTNQRTHARFRYLEGVLYKPSENFTNLQNINQRFSQENDPIKISAKFIAVACVGTGGQIGILRRDSPGRVPEKFATIVHGADVIAMEFDPFDPMAITTAGADNKLQMWRIPDAPLSEESFFDLEEYVHVTADKIHQIRFHPWAKGVVAVLVSDGDEQAVYIYHGLMLHFIIGKTGEGIHSFAWSPDGERIALTTKKSKQIRLYDAHTQEQLGKGPAMDSIRPCRISWLSNNYICLAGFGTGSQRQIALYNASDMAQPLDKKTIDVGPGLLVPFVDPDCNIVYLDDRGSRLTHAFEVVENKLIELPKFESTQPSLGIAVLPKKYADVEQSELLRAYRLNAQSIESVGFQVPRKRPEYFQDDIFPATLDSEIPSVDAMAWIGGAVAEPKYVDLCPQGMIPLSQAPPEAIRKRNFEIEPEYQEDNTKNAISAMLSRVDDLDEDEAEAKGNDSGSDWGD
ncbi:hypothetical protein GGI25_002431 [Coemansia spiralis]|uniref:DUF1899 domain-containing protein n=2 Tax=Coemansia TaxID=4863 RepID=A0A9W8G8R2_9FUNG|nr:hypothetical protein EDC05_001006 [Coemansia umbellata]KAJ2678259.1 hypothetical protein GGI25_002431 [Coemansia spiralis]